MIRSALRIVVAAITAVVVVVGTVLCILFWKDDRRARAFVLVVGLVLAGCAGSVSLPNPVFPGNSEYATVVRWWNAQPLQVTTMHAYIYSMMEECLGIVGDFWRIRWYSADFVQQADYTRLGGLWIREGPAIVLDWRVANDPVTVSHEEIHDILAGGNADHDDPRLAQCEIKRLVPVDPR